MVEIVDRESAQKWLVEAPRKAQIAFATRSALRVLPALAFAPSALQSTALENFRAVLTCCVASVSPDSDHLRAAASEALGGIRAVATADEKLVSHTVMRALATVNRQDFAYDAGGVQIRTADETAADAMEASTHVGRRSVLLVASLDVSALERGPPHDLFRLPLWAVRADGEQVEVSVPRSYADINDVFGEFLTSNSGTWGFWSRWYRGFVKGEPLDWALQREVALIPDEDWKKGPEHIARLIEEIEARFALKARIRELEDELSRASKDRFGIGGNDPPKAIEDAPSIAKEFTIIWAPLQDLKSEAEKAQPDRTIVRLVAERLRAALLACGSWSAKKLDGAATAAFVAAGTASGTAFAAWMAGHGDKVVRVIEAAEAWLATLP